MNGRPRRRVGDSSGAASRRVLIGLTDNEAAGRLAKLFSDSRVLPTLVFSCEDLAQEAGEETYALIVLDAAFVCGHFSRCLKQVRAASLAPIMAVGHVADDDDAVVDIVLPDRNAAKIAAYGAALVDLSRPVGLPNPLRWGPLELDVGHRQARWHDEELRLTTPQFRIMEVLVMAAGRVVTIEQLGRRVWGDAGISDLDRLVAHVRRIRRRIEEDPSSPKFLLRVRNGFRLADAGAAADEGRSLPER